MIFEIEIGQIREVNRKIRSKNLNTQLSTYSGNGVLQSTHLTKNCVLAISLRGKLNTRKTRVNSKVAQDLKQG